MGPAFFPASTAHKAGSEYLARGPSLVGLVVHPPHPLRREVRRGEIELAFAFSGEEALAYLAEHGASVVLVLSDINMPGMSGLELLQHIKAASEQVAVCMMTAYGNDQYQLAARSYGSDGYVTKPIDFEELKHQIRTLADSA